MWKRCLASSRSHPAWCGEAPEGGLREVKEGRFGFFLSPLHFDAFEGCVVVAQEVHVFSRIFFLSAIGRAECSGSVAQHHVLVNGEQSSKASF